MDRPIIDSKFDDLCRRDRRSERNDLKHNFPTQDDVYSAINHNNDADIQFSYHTHDNSEQRSSTRMELSTIKKHKESTKLEWPNVVVLNPEDVGIVDVLHHKGKEPLQNVVFVNPIKNSNADLVHEKPCLPKKVPIKQIRREKKMKAVRAHEEIQHTERSRPVGLHFEVMLHQSAHDVPITHSDVHPITNTPSSEVPNYKL